MWGASNQWQSGLEAGRGLVPEKYCAQKKKRVQFWTNKELVASKEVAKTESGCAGGTARDSDSQAGRQLQGGPCSSF
jgi:hypothetical protein